MTGTDPQVARLLATTAAVVVHHKAFPDVLGTVGALLDQGIAARDVLVVDNSESEEIAESLRAQLPAEVGLAVVANDGYAGAINYALDQLERRETPPAQVLVSTHETRPARGALALMLEVLDRHPRFGVVGPALTNAEQSTDTLWSTGGRLTRWTRRAKHVGAGEPVPTSVGTGVLEARDWLDGSFCLYRAAAIAGRRISEEYFLYFEEVDFHRAIAADGWGVGCVVDALVGQSSHGMPPFYYGRNLRLFQRRRGTPLSRLLALPEALALLGRGLVRGERTRDDVRAFLSGWLAWRGGVAPVRPRR